MPRIVTIDKVYSKPKQEEIVSATYTDPETDKVTEGEDHLAANPDAPEKQEDRETPEYGFKTSSGRVVSRKEAYKIAKKSNQLKSSHPKKILHTSNLKNRKKK
jgi:hypothetical protein